VGYVDKAGVLAQAVPLPVEGDPDKAVDILAYGSEESAKEALKAGDVQAYYVIAPDYLETRRVQLVYDKRPGENATRQFWDFMQFNLAIDGAPDVARRAALGVDVWARSADGSREFPPNVTVGLFFPLITAFVFVYLVVSTGGQLMGVLLVEKESRTAEILMTSISPGQLMGGKVIGVVAANLTMLLGWIAIGLLVLLVGVNYLGVSWLQDLSINVPSLIQVCAVMLPEYVLIAALMAALGASVVDTQEAQQVAGAFALPMMVPIWLAMLYIESPNSPIGIALTLLPGSAPMATAVRASFYDVPNWQIACSAAIQALCALGAVWLAGRAFRLGMLRYGQGLKLREIISRRKPLAAAGGADE
jgi:ABC-2 type transport system permease protein